MFPIGDDNTGERTVPIVAYALIALNVLFFFVELSGGDSFVKQWAFVASRFMANPAADFPTAAHLDVHARRVAPPRREHALPVDLRR
jgi:membrane associated rhomboid family serine protease